MTRASRWTLIGLIACTGCHEATQVAPVAGRITLDGAPLPKAEVRFQPAGGGVNPGAGAFGRTDSDGRFTLNTMDPVRPGAVVGKHRVWITTVLSEFSSADGRLPPERVPAPYRNGELEFNVPNEGTSKADFDLKAR